MYVPSHFAETREDVLHGWHVRSPHPPVVVGMAGLSLADPSPRR
jgi:hypothetical protein